MIAIRKDDDFEIRRFSSWLKVLTRQELVHFGTLGAPRSPFNKENLEQNSKIVKVFLCFFGSGLAVFAGKGPQMADQVLHVLRKNR